MKLLASFLISCIFTISIIGLIYGMYKLVELLQARYNEKTMIVIISILFTLMMTVVLYVCP